MKSMRIKLVLIYKDKEVGSVFDFCERSDTKGNIGNGLFNFDGKRPIGFIWKPYKQ